MSETLVLPKSGLVLKQDPNCGFPSYVLSVGSICFRVEQVITSGSRWRASQSISQSSGAYGYGTSGTKEHCLAWLDARVLELRAALLPPGGFVVVPDEATVKRVADALVVGVVERRLRRARAVLAALAEPRP